MRLVQLVTVAVLCALLGACGHVAPYEREYLARPSMDTKRLEKLCENFVAHVQDAREGAPGRGESAGGGCGCN